MSMIVINAMASIVTIGLGALIYLVIVSEIRGQK